MDDEGFSVIIQQSFYCSFVGYVSLGIFIQQHIGNPFPDIAVGNLHAIRPCNIWRKNSLHLVQIQELSLDLQQRDTGLIG